MTIDADEPPGIGGSCGSPPIVDEERGAYDRTFWLTYLANGLATVCNALMVRYADFVNVLGGEERQLGLIVGCGMLGSILMRFAQGIGIDHYGAGRVWTFSIIAYTLTLAAHLALTTAYSPSIFVVRTLMQSSLAGVFGASITFVSLRVAPQRMAEIIGTLGTSGFIGIMVGPMVSDWICGSGPPERAALQRLFLLAMTISIMGSIATWLATRGQARSVPRRRPRLSRVLKRYTPWVTALVAAAMGAGFAIPFTFLRPFAVEMGIRHIGIYFVVYAGTAFIARLSTRQLFERYGNRPWIIAGMVLLSLSYVLYLPATHLWQLTFPAAVAGVAHALLFPSVMAAGTSAFPRRFMGVATSVMLAMFDFGTFIGAPVAGAFLREGRRQSLAPYPWMFGGTAVVFCAITLVFWLRTRGLNGSGQKSRSSPSRKNLAKN